SAKTGASQSMSMKGVVTVTIAGAVNVTGLSPFNSTIFRLIDSGQGEAKLELYESRMKPLAPTLLKRYSLIKRILLQKRESMNTDFQDDDGQAVTVKIDDYDKSGIPRR